MDDRSALLYENISQEQVRVLDLLENGNHVVVEANPGAGKTKMILQIARAFPRKNICVLSFNADLAHHTADELKRLQEERTGWSSVHTYHSLLGVLTQTTVYDDILFGDMLRYKNFNVLSDSFNNRDFDYLIVDEAQDLKRLFVLFLAILIGVVSTRKDTLQLIFLHGNRQTLYSFYPINKADERYAIHAEQIFGALLPSARAWTHMSLSVSFRLPPQVADVVNAMSQVNAPVIVSGHSRVRPENWVTLYIADIYKDAAALVTEIIEKEAGNRHNYGKILLLFESIRANRGPARHVINILSTLQIPVNVSRGSKTNAKKQMNQNKVKVASLCSQKGCEAEVVIMVCQSSLFSEHVLSNPQFVGLTRVKSRLYIIVHPYNSLQHQIDKLVSHPNITQRNLRVIAKRTSLKKEVQDNKLAQESKTIDVLTTDTLFSFLDVAHLENLLLHFNVEKWEMEHTYTYDTQDEIEQYVSSFVVSQNNNKTFIDCVKPVNQAIMFALEFLFTHRMPSKFNDVYRKLGYGMSNNAVDATMYHHSEAALCDISNITRVDEDSVIKHLNDFAKLAVVCDAYHHYCDMLFQIERYDFMQQSGVSDRFLHLVQIIKKLYSEHYSNDPKELQWGKRVNALYSNTDLSPFEMTAIVDVMSPDKQFVVHFAHDVDISHDDRLRAVAGALLLDQTLQPVIYIVNLISLDVEKISVVSDVKQTVVSPDTTPTHLVRRKPCMFLQEALDYKFWSATNDAQVTDDTTFVTDIRNDIQRLLQKIETS